MTLCVENGSFSYGKQPVLRDIRFSVSSGDLMAILGPNGAGKTTLLRCIMGMLRWERGESRIDGKKISSMPARELWQKLAYVPQAKAAATAATALQAVLIGRSSHLHIFESPAKNDIAFALSTLERLGIADLSQKPCAQMSGGELQMVLIARALVSKPKILILDEPESNLDFKNQLIVLNTISELAQDGMTCIFNTHYPTHALQRANKALILHRGGAFRFGETADVVTEQNIRSVFGVNSVIGEVETEHALLQSVVPLSLSQEADIGEDAQEDRQLIAGLTLILENNDRADAVNRLLHEYGAYIIGRMGLPYKSAGCFIMQVSLDAPKSVLRRLGQRVATMQGVSAKLTCAKEKGGTAV